MQIVWLERGNCTIGSDMPAHAGETGREMADDGMVISV